MSDTKAPERPTCGTCPHWEPHAPGDAQASGLCTIDPPSTVGVFVPYAPYGDSSVSGGVQFYLRRPEMDAHEGCGRHPDFPAFVESKSPQRSSVLAPFAWHNLNAGPLTIAACNEDDARTKAKDALVEKLRAEPETYSAADLDFDLLMIVQTKPDAGEE